MRRVRCVVEDAEAGQRLDRLLASRGFLPTRSRIAGLIRGGYVTVNGTQRKASFPVPAGSVIEISIPPEPPSTVEPEPIPKLCENFERETSRAWPQVCQERIRKALGVPTKDARIGPSERVQPQAESSLGGQRPCRDLRFHQVDVR